MVEGEWRGDGSVINANSDEETEGLRKWAEKLIILAKSAFENIEFDESDNYGFMVLTFLHKQICHLESILRLGESRDVELIARSMMEGMCQIKWVADKKEERAYRWRAWAVICNWRMMKRNEAEKQPMDKKSKENLLRYVEQVKDLFLNPKAIELKEAGKKLPDDPFVKTWSNIKLWEVFKKVNAKPLYETHYHDFSNWHHWNAGGVGKAIKGTEGGYSFFYTDKRSLRAALAVGFQCLIETLESADSHLRLGFDEEINEMVKAYVEWNHSLDK